MVGTFVNDKNHLKHMLDICAILIERGYNVNFFTFLRNKFRFFFWCAEKSGIFFIDPWDLEFCGAAAEKIGYN